MTRKLLLVEDDSSLGQSLTESLTADSFAVTWCQELKEVSPLEAFDVALVDLMLPDGSGFDLLQRLPSSLPKILMTALNTAENRLNALELGVHEFIPKPFLYKELKLRLDRILSLNTPTANPSLLKLPEVEVDLEKMCVRSTKGFVFFATKDFKVLKYLIECAPRAVSRDEILDQIWGAEQFPSNRTVDNSIVRLRELLHDREAQLIRSVRGIGYQWVFEKDEVDN